MVLEEMKIWKIYNHRQLTHFYKRLTLAFGLAELKTWNLTDENNFINYMILGYNARIFVPLWKKNTDCYVAICLLFLVTWDKVYVMLPSSHEMFSLYFTGSLKQEANGSHCSPKLEWFRPLTYILHK